MLTVNLSGADDAPLFTKPANITLTDTFAPNTFTVQSGRLAATDAEKGALTYGIQGGTPQGPTVKLTTTYGTLTVTKASGAYFFAPNATAINALDANAGADFTVTATAGGATSRQRLTLNLTGANDAPILATPTVIALTDTQQADSFAPITGKLAATDAESSTISYKIYAAGAGVTDNGSVTAMTSLTAP
ncbi:MAG: hypothetical protein EPN21_16610 [Methylococcaceae bacterium]|nr:MAG: hypothetical protein EPN21_16610 [Methylococcaceae bacterium]